LVQDDKEWTRSHGVCVLSKYFLEEAAGAFGCSLWRCIWFGRFQNWTAKFNKLYTLTQKKQK